MLIVDAPGCGLLGQIRQIRHFARRFVRHRARHRVDGSIWVFGGAWQSAVHRSLTLKIEWFTYLIEIFP